MSTWNLVVLTRQPENLTFDILWCGAMLVFLAVFVLWDRRYRRVLRNYRSRNWRRVDGLFDEGEVMTMREARSHTVAGYEVWLGYDYEAEGEQVGVYRLPRKTKDEAEAALNKLANQRIVVRVSPRNSKRSFVADEDLSSLLPPGR